MIALRFVAGLALALLLHVGATWVYPGFPRIVDLFLVATVAAARSGRAERGLLAGSLAGWVRDVLSGGPLGLYGFADAAVGYMTALVAQRLVVQRRISLAGVFAAAAAAQGLLLALLGWLVVGGSELPRPLDLGLRVATTAAAGVSWTELAGGVSRSWLRRRNRPSGSLRIDKSLLP